MGQRRPVYPRVMLFLLRSARRLHRSAGGALTRCFTPRPELSPRGERAMGGTLAKLSVSALMFDYILTGPISGVSAGQYIVGLLAQVLTYLGHPWNPSQSTVNLSAAGIAALVTMYFWWRNTRGMRESSDDALRIMYVTTVMVVVLLFWCGLTILMRPEAQRYRPARSLITWHSIAMRSAGCEHCPSALGNCLRHGP